MKTSTAQLTFDSGGIGLLGASRHAGQWYERIEMIGDNKTVIMESPDRVSIITPEHELRESMTPIHKGLANVIDTIGFRPCARHFVDCVISREKPLTSAEDSYKTHDLMDKILRAAGLPDLSQDWSEHAI